MTGMAVRPVRLGHVGIAVRDMDRMVAFYPGQLVSPHAHEFVLITIWKDMESVKAFTGRNWLTAILPEEDLPILEEIEVNGYEVFGLPDPPRKPLFNMI